MSSVESRAQEPRCLCPDPDFNVVIDPVIFPNGATLTQLQGAFPFFQGNTMTNNCLSIQGRLIIDKNFEIIGGEVIMQPGAQIVARRPPLFMGELDFVLTDINTNGGIHGCTAMWAGIGVAGNYINITINNSLLQDAQAGLDLNWRFTKVFATGSIFRNNFIAIRLTRPNTPPYSNGTILSLDGNTFTTDGQYLPGFQGQDPDPATSRFTGTGIWAENASGVGVGATNLDPNIFDGLTLGVYGINSTATIVNNIFRNIRHTPSSQFSTEFYIAVRMDQLTLFPLAGQSLNVKNTTFENCSVGIRATNLSELTIEDNLFHLSANGVQIHNPRSTIARIINGNKFNVARGVSVTGTGTAREIVISENDFQLNPDAATETDFSAVAVNGWTAPIAATGDFLISDNVILMMPNPGGGYFSGINVVNTIDAVIEWNKITVQSQGRGIVVGGAQNTIVAYNKIESAGGDYAVRGVEVGFSPNTTVECNNVYGNICLLFIGSSDCIAANCTQIRGNELEQIPGSLHTWGELVLLNAVTSPQKWQGNKWLGVDVNDPSSFGANYVGDVLMAPLSKFIPHTNQLPYHPEHVLVNNSFQDPTVWFEPELSSTFYVCDPMAPQYTDPDDVILIYETYAEGGFEAAGYGKGAQWMAERHLYRNLKTTPALLSGTILPQFYSDAASGPIGAFYDIEQGIGTLGQIPDSVKTLLETLYEDEQTYTEAWEDVELLIANADSIELPALEQERQDIEDDLETVASEIALILQDLDADRLAHVQDLQTDNAAITPANNPGHYLKSVNEIYLAHAADHSEWTTTERATLDSIGLLCPSEGGDAVYIARAMLGQLHGDDCMELPVAFQAPVPPVHATLEEPVLGIYPNPGSNEFFLNVPVTQSGQAELRLYSLTGKQVHRVILPAETRSELNLSVLPGGLYLYEVWGDGMRLMNGKLSKISQ
jgi:hypothetical protein